MLIGAGVSAAIGGFVSPAFSQDAAEAASPAAPRPAILFNRWQEDWSVLADPAVQREPFDDLKPSLTLHPAPTLTLMLAAAGQWRETTADAVYTMPNIPLAGTAGRPGAYTGTYGQFRVDWQVSEHYAAAIEAVHFAVREAIAAPGGHDSDHLGVELRYGW